MQPRADSAPSSTSALSYAPAETRRPWREAALLARYHLRLLDGWLLVLMLLGFGTCAIVVGVQSQSPHTTDVRNAAGLSLFVLESGAALFAGLLGSALIINDPLLEVLLATRGGIVAPVAWRAALGFGMLLGCCAGFQLCLAVAGLQQDFVLAPLTWLAPAVVMGMLGLFGSLLARNAALGAALAAAPLAGSLFLYNALFSLPAARPFLISYTCSAYAAGVSLGARDWLTNRLALLGIALLLAGCNLWLLRREERLLGGVR